MRPGYPKNKVMILAGSILLLAFGLFYVLRIHSFSKKIEMNHTANNSPLFEPGDKPMKVCLRTVEMATGKPFSMAATIHESKNRGNQMRQLLLAYLQGPRSGKDQVPVPEGLVLNEFYFTSQGTAVVDLSAIQVIPGKFGFFEETLFIRCLIETLSQNFFEIKQVKVLVDGQEAPTLGGHYALGTADTGGSLSPVVK
jgi:hypothetical protein